jgi:hypothetical protein
MNTNSSTGAKQAVNVGKVERIASLVAAGVLLYKAVEGLADKQSGTSYETSGTISSGATYGCR